MIITVENCFGSWEMRKTKILIACFMTVLTVVGAGYAYLLRRSEAEIEVRTQRYRAITGEDAASAIEELDKVFGECRRWGYSSRSLGQIISASSRAASAVGYLERGLMRESGLYSFLGACEKAAFESLAGQGDAQTLDELAIFAHRIKEAGTDFKDSQSIELALEGIMTDPEFEALMLSLGMAGFAADSDFHSVIGQDVSEKEAKRTAEKYLGKNYAFKVSESPLAYTVYASNISATVSKRGGYLMQLMFDLPEQEARLSEEEALAAMMKFMSDAVSEYDILALQDLSLDGIYRGIFCPERNGVLCLDERISVGVSASSGRVCLFDAGAYYRSRGGDVRAPSNAMTAQAISEMWGGESASLCKVRLGSGVEALCFRVGDLFVDSISGKPIEGVKIK